MGSWKCFSAHLPWHCLERAGASMESFFKWQAGRSGLCERPERPTLWKLHPKLAESTAAALHQFQHDLELRVTAMANPLEEHHFTRCRSADNVLLHPQWRRQLPDDLLAELVQLQQAVQPP